MQKVHHAPVCVTRLTRPYADMARLCVPEWLIWVCIRPLLLTYCRRDLGRRLSPIWRTMKLTHRVAVLGVAGVAALSAMTGSASADTLGPATKYFAAPIPIIGSTLSDSSGTPSVQMKDGWAVNDSDGICSATTDLDQGGSTRTIWNAPSTGRTVTSLINNTYTGSFKVGTYNYLETYASDCLGNTSYDYGYFNPDLAQQGAASYSAGWSTAAGSIWSGGSVMKSTKVGAKASFTFSYSSMVSLVSDKASDRGKVALSVDGQPATTVSLNGATKNRVIVWKSKYLSRNGTHLLTAKVVSGRVDIDAFLTTY